MADKRISELTSASLPLEGTEEIAIVQSGVTKKTSVNNVLGGSKYFYHEETNQWTLNTNKNIIKPNPLYGYKNTELNIDSGLTDPLLGGGILSNGNGTASFCKLPFSDLKLKKIFLTSRNNGSVNSFRLLVVSGTRLNNAGFSSQYSSTNIIYDEIITGFSNDRSINLEVDLPSPSVITDDEVYVFYAHESGTGNILYALKTGLLFEE